MNVVVLLVELWATCIPILKQDFVLAALWPLVYGQFTMIRLALDPATRSCLILNNPEGDCPWPYFFLDTSQAFAVFVYAALMGLTAVAFFGIERLARCRTLPSDKILLKEPVVVQMS